MTNPTLAVVLDDPARAAEAGTPVRGRVEASADGSWLGSITLGWRLRATPAFGRERTNDLPRKSLFAGELAADASQAFELSIPPPSHPPTYEGTLIRYTWELVAIAEDHAGNRSEARSEVVVAPAPGMPTVRMREPGDPSRVREVRAWPLVLTALATVASVALALAGWPLGSSFMRWFFGVWGLLGLLASALLLHGWRIARRIGNVQIGVERARGSGYREAGGSDGEHQCTVWLRPEADVAKVSATVEVYEEVEGPQQSDGKRIERHGCWSGTTTLQPVEPGTWSGRLPMPEPASAPLSVRGAWMRIEWRVTAIVTLADGHSVPHQALLVAARADERGT